MAKRIETNLIIGNALIIFSKENKIITEQIIADFCLIVDKLLPDEYYTTNYSLESFLYNYPYFLKRNGECLIINNSNNIYYKLIRYFRIGIPKQLTLIFYKAYELLENDYSNNMLNKEISLKKSKRIERVNINGKVIL